MNIRKSAVYKILKSQYILNPGLYINRPSFPPIISMIFHRKMNCPGNWVQVSKPVTTGHQGITGLTLNFIKPLLI